MKLLILFLYLFLNIKFHICNNSIRNLHNLYTQPKQYLYKNMLHLWKILMILQYSKYQMMILLIFNRYRLQFYPHNLLRKWMLMQLQLLWLKYHKNGQNFRKLIGCLGNYLRNQQRKSNYQSITVPSNSSAYSYLLEIKQQICFCKVELPTLSLKHFQGKQTLLKNYSSQSSSNLLLISQYHCIELN